MIFSVEPNLKSIREICLKAESIFFKWDIPENISSDLVLSIDEALTNICTHGFKGFPGDSPKEISLELIKDARKVNIIIRDNGKKFLIQKAPRLVPSDHIKNGIVGGLGVYLIKRHMDEVKSYYLENQNVLWMTKLIKKSDSMAPDFITTPTADAFVENEILIIRITSGAIIELKDAQEHLRKYFKMIEAHPDNKARAMMIDTRGMTMISNDARSYYSDLPQTEINAIAIIVDSIFTKWLANFFISFNKNPVSLQMFNTESDARTWLEKILNKSHSQIKAFV